jgi:hypothetical protein
VHKSGSIWVDHFWHVGEDNQVLPTDSVGFKPFTAGFGTRTVDSSLYAPASTASLAFNADGGDYMDTLADGIFVPSDNWIVEFWVNPTTVANAASLLTLGSETGVAQIGLDGSGHWAFAEMNIAYGNNSVWASAGAWTHLAWVRDGGVNKFFVGGVQLGSDSASLTNNGRVHLGIKPGGGETFQGRIDEVRFSTFAAGQFNPAVLLGYVPSGTVSFSGRSWDTLIQVATAQYGPPQTNQYSGSGNLGLMTGRFGVDTAMTTPISLKVGDTVSYDFLVTSELRNFSGTNADTWFAETGSGFRNGVGDWVTRRDMRYNDSRTEEFWTATDGSHDTNPARYVNQSRGPTQATHARWLFTSTNTATLTLTLDGDTSPYATWTDTFSHITNIQSFRIGLYDSEQDLTIANFKVTSATPHSQIVSADNSSAFWRLNEGGGAIAYDSVGGHHATYTGTLTFGVSGAVSNDTAVEFDGSTGYAALPYSAALNPQGSFTVEAWVKPNAIPNSSGTPCPISSSQFSGDRSGWQIRERDNGYQFVLYNHVGSGTAANVLGGGTPSTTTWTHLVGVYDGTTAYLYVNGSLANSASAAGFVANYNDGVNAPGPFTIGARSSLDNNFSGSVDEAAFYNRALTPAEIQSHFADKPRMTFGTSGSGNISITWPVGTLQESTNVTGPYTDVITTSPATIPMTAPQKFFRIKL